MPKVSPIQSSFNAGELSPLLYGRVDADRYKAGLAVCLNYVPTLQGPIVRRPGSKYTHEVRHSSRNNQILIPFKYNTEDAYVIEYGTTDDNKEYLRFFKNNALLTDLDKTISGVNLANPVELTVTGHGQAGSSNRFVVGGVGGTVQLNNREFLCTSVTANVLSLRDAQTSATIDGVSFTAYTSGGIISRPYEQQGPNISSTINFTGFRHAQVADVLFWVNPEYSYTGGGSNRPITTLSRFSDTSWTWANPTINDGPYLPVNDTTVTLSPSATTGSISIVANEASAINGGIGFQSPADLQRFIRIKNGTTWGFAQITAVGSNVSVTATVLGDLNSVSPTAVWHLGAFRTGQWPTGICFHEERLYLGGGVNPQNLAASAVGDYFNFAPTDASDSRSADDSFAVILASNEANGIKWLQSEEKGVVIGTAGGPMILRPTDNGAAISAGNAKANRACSFGSANIQPQQIDKATLYAQNSGKKVREFLYYYDVDGFRASDITVLSEHITGNGVEQFAAQKEPQPLLWARKANGGLISMTYERDIDNLKVGWSRHELGGYSNASHTLAPVVSRLAVIPSSDGLREELWMIVKRYINGRERRYIEYFPKFFDEQDDPEDAYHVDSGLTYDSSPTATISGLNHLEGEVVQILADGAHHPDRTVTLGKVSLEASYSVVHLGYKFTSQGKTLRFDAGAADGTALGKTQRMHAAGLMLHRTGGLKIGMDFSTGLNQVNFRQASDNISDPVPLYSGIIRESLEADYNSSNQLCWQQDTPLPGTILSILPSIVTQDR